MAYTLKDSQTPTIDTWSPAHSTSPRGYSWTPSNTHNLDRVELTLYRSSVGVEECYAILNAADGSHKPTGGTLATSSTVILDDISLPTSAPGAVVQFDFPTPFEVQSGTEYTITIWPSTTYVYLGLDNASALPGWFIYYTSSWQSYNYDVWFKTYEEEAAAEESSALTMAANFCITAATTITAILWSLTQRMGVRGQP